MIAKAGLGLIGLSAIGVGGVALAKPHLLGMDYMPNTFHALSKDSDYGTKKNNDYSNDKFGNKYRNYLVGVTNKTEGNDETSNKSWWEWAYRKLQNDGVKEGKFQITKGQEQKVDKAYSKDTNDGKALNNVCKEAYKVNNTNGFDAGTDNAKFKKSEVWKYCSPLGKEPTKINKSDYGDKIGSQDTDFVSTKDESNALFWFIRDKEIKGDDNFEKITHSGSDSSASTHFKKPGKTLKELCEDAYTKPKSESNPSKDDAKKYCVFEISSAN